MGETKRGDTPDEQIIPREGALESKTEEVFGRGEFNFEVGGDTSLHVVARREEDNPDKTIVEDVLLQNSSGKNKSLLEFLPEGWQIICYRYGIPQMHAKADHLNKVIGLPSGYIIISSANIPENEKLPQPLRQEQETLFGKTFCSSNVNEKLREVNTFERVPYFQKSDEAILTFLHEAGHANHPNHRNLPEDIAERERQLLLHETEIIPEERDAWAFAIKTIRKLKREGFDFGEAFSKEKIEKEIEHALSSYDDPKTKKIMHIKI